MIAAIGSSAYLTRRTAPLLRELNGMESPLLVGTDHPGGARPTEQAGRTVITDRDAVLADRNVDCVYISSATGRHFEDCREALAAGKHVLVEKPICLRAAETAELDRLARAADRTVFECLSYPYHPAWREFVARVRAIDRAEPVTVSAVFRIPGREAKDFRLHPWHGGAAADLGTYCVDALVRLGAVVEDLAIGAVLLADSDTDAGTAVTSRPRDSRTFTGSWAIGDTYCNGVVVADPGRRLELFRVFSLPPDAPGLVVERLRGEQEPTSVVSSGPSNATRACLEYGMRQVRDTETAGLVGSQVIARRIAALETLTTVLPAHAS
ncbi:Gfo/Idh/MocA family protein [Streptomyces halstedii]|uniref:Gfo/Idh/MocA family oxidoreductase n=1 Tax=Streptomyces halstedii TaxID=1944 RepID=A0A6N9U3P1_STRHA|nr:Gfo/Idh/MocA family oxidoreductase [Streptomyces halstedii]NEA18258.1 Gfo/Idh/MocA family oxidoreductase [Streptomyces halstedii]